MASEEVLITQPEYLIDWMNARGVRNGLGLVQLYGLDPVKEVAHDLQQLEEMGINWQAGIRNSGAYIHAMIKERRPGGLRFKDKGSG